MGNPAGSSSVKEIEYLKTPGGINYRDIVAIIRKLLKTDYRFCKRMKKSEKGKFPVFFTCNLNFDRLNDWHVSHKSKRGLEEANTGGGRH